MKTFEQLGIEIPKIIFPKKLKTESWACLACDQYTQDEEYWSKAKKNAEDISTLNIIFPEVYLNKPEKNIRIQKIRSSMEAYMQNDIFAPEKEEFIYLERKTSYGRNRKGLIAVVDLESYDWKPFSKTLIRATEATIPERIPPRMEIRKGAPIETSHIMLLINDAENILIEGIGNKIKHKTPVYSGNLMLNGGSITGWAADSKEEIEYIRSSLEKISDKNTAADGSVFLFAAGDGNHSLATAKAVWDEYKNELKNKNLPEKEILKSKVRYALVEIVNIYDEGLTFEPIHRVIFNIDNNKLLNCLADALEGTKSFVNSAEELEQEVKNSVSNFGFAYNTDGKKEYSLIRTNIKDLAVSRFQPVLDDFIKDNQNAQIDYIHGAAEIFRLGAKNNSIGILMPPIAKDSFFNTINSTGILPRKSFSMGEADEKRFYLECRKLF